MEYLLLLFASTLPHAALRPPVTRGLHLLLQPYFFKRGAWEVQFLEADAKTSLPRKFTFTHPDKIRELARRGEALSSQKQELQDAIEKGRGGVYFRLTPGQYGKLKRV